MIAPFIANVEILVEYLNSNLLPVNTPPINYFNETFPPENENSPKSYWILFVDGWCSG